jgi:hypothetical protein
MGALVPDKSQRDHRLSDFREVNDRPPPPIRPRALAAEVDSVSVVRDASGNERPKDDRGSKAS